MSQAYIKYAWLSHYRLSHCSKYTMFFVYKTLIKGLYAKNISVVINYDLIWLLRTFGGLTHGRTYTSTDSSW